MFGGFINEILTNIKAHPVSGGYDDQSFIRQNNLRAHKTLFFTNLIEDRPTPNHSRSVDQPPYCPKIAPIEFIVCELASQLSHCCMREWTALDIRKNIVDIKLITHFLTII